MVRWGDGFVGCRGFIAGPGGVGGNGGVFRRQLERENQLNKASGTDQYMASVARRTYWFQGEDTRRDDEKQRNDNQRS